MPDDKKPTGSTALDKLLTGLDAMSAKLDSMGARLDSMEAARKDADEPPVPPPAPKEGEGEPVPVAADKKKPPVVVPDAASPPSEIPPPPMPPPAAPAKDALPPEFLKGKEEGEEKDEKKEEAADSVGDLNVLRKRLAKLEAQMPKDRTDHDLAADQAAADSVYSMFGESAPRPLIGDSRTSYVLRNLERFKVHSPAWKDVDLTPISVDEKVLNIAADQIYAAARSAASNPASVPDGTLRAITTRTPTGHIETRFMGSPSAWMNRHAPNRRFATAINLMKKD